MDESALRRLASAGLRTRPQDRLQDLGNWCDDHAVNTGDARYSFLGRTLQDIGDWWDEHSERGTGSAADVTEVDRLLREGLVPVLEAHEAQEGAYLARELEREISRFLR